MIAEYIERPKSEHQGSEAFINVFVFFTTHLYRRMSVFTHLRYIGKSLYTLALSCCIGNAW